MSDARGLIIRPRGFGKISCSDIAEKSGRLKAVRSDEVTGDDLDTDYIFRWGCRTVIRSRGKIINRIPALKEVGNKGDFREKCAANGLSPKTFRNLDDISEHFLSSATPLVLRPIHHKQGKDLNVVRNTTEAIITSLKYSEWYASELIQKEREYRAVVSQGRILFIYEKIPDNRENVAWNHAQGGTSDVLKWSQWPLEVMKNAVSAFALSGLDYGACDIMVDRDGNAYCLEINTAPETTSEYRQNCFAKAFNYILDKGNETIPPVEGFGWRGYIHPVMSDLAKTEV